MRREAMSAPFEVEWLKMHRSRFMAVTTAMVILVPPLLASAFVAAAVRDGTDPLTLKARALLPGTGWDGFVAAIGQVFASGGLLGIGIGVAWCFGREYADRTIVSLYASATPRGAVAVAKLVLLTVWAVVVAAGLGPAALLIGLLAGLGQPDGAALLALGRVVVLAILTGVSALTVAVFASVGRGYLPAFGGLIGLIIAGQVAVLAGAGTWFPLSSPAVWAADNPTMGSVSAGQLVLVPLASLAVAVGTVVWWRRSPLV